MIVSPTEELSAFFFCALAGSGAGFLFDLFRLFRYRKKRGTVRVAAEDALFFLLSAVLIFWVLFQKNDGMVRLYEWTAIAFGVLLYALFLSPVVFRVLLFFVSILKKSCRMVIKTLLFPIVLICRILKRPFFAVISPVRLWGKKLKCFLKERRRNRKKSRKLAKKIWKKV